MPSTLQVHPSLEIDTSVPRKNESLRHWAAKAAIVEQLRSNPSCTGEIETEKKTSDLIGDIRCELTESPPDIPQQFVVEVETPQSSKDRLRATTHHLRFGYDVYWVFTLEANAARRNTESTLEEHMSRRPSLGVISLEEGELSLGLPITWDDFSFPEPFLGRHEIYIPTYDRYEEFFDHGDFLIDGERAAIYRRPGSGKIYVSWSVDDQQQTLPQEPTWDIDTLLHRIRTGDVQRVSPVRGPP